MVYRSPSLMGRTFCGYRCRDAAKMEKRVKDGQAKCSKCGAWKPVSEFVRGPRGRPHSHCKPCNAKWHVPDTERKKAYRPAYTLSPEEKAENKRAANQLQHSKRRAAGEVPHKSWFVCEMEYQDGKCVYCRADIRDGFHVDHKHPVSRGGTNAKSNLQLTCARCNMVKGAMTHEEFLVSKKRTLPRIGSWA
jgi:5-methylcytosine-specific restriction endonuclease McrA